MEESPLVEAVSADGDDLTPKSVTGIVHRMTDMVSLRKRNWSFIFEEHSSVGTLSNWHIVRLALVTRLISVTPVSDMSLCHSGEQESDAVCQVRV